MAEGSELRSSILDAIRENVKQLDRVAARLDDAATDLYSKNTPGDGYAKNTQHVLPLERILDASGIAEAKKAVREFEARD